MFKKLLWKILKQETVEFSRAGSISAAIAVTASCFHLYTAAFGLFDAMTQRAWHWMFMGVLLFLCYPMTKKRPKNKIDIWDWGFAILMIAGCANILLNYAAIAMREGSAIPSDIYIGNNYDIPGNRRDKTFNGLAFTHYGDNFFDLRNFWALYAGNLGTRRFYL